MTGQILELWRYPVKSLKGEKCSHLQIEKHGVLRDRIYAFKDKTKNNSFPWFTIRQCSEMLQFTPYLNDQGELAQILSPSGEIHKVSDPQFISSLEKLWGGTFELVHNPKNILDDGPVSLLSSQTVSLLEQQLNQKVDFMRFRPNLLVKWNEATSLEENLVGKKIRMGEVVLKVESRDPRCVVVNVDPSTSQKNPEILKNVAKSFGGNFGVYLSVLKTGKVNVGDKVEVE